MKSMRLAGKRAFITGAASGIGAATYELFAAEGAEVVGVDITDRDGLLYCDVTEQDSVNAAITETVGCLGGVDVVVNVAGIGGMIPLEAITLDRWESQFAVNVTGPMLVSRAALPHLRRAKGNIVSVASISGLQAQPYMSAYGASKAALLHFMKSMAIELASDGIRVNCVCPGGVGPMPTAEQATARVPSGVSLEMFTRMGSVLSGITEPVDIADAMVYLASDAARSITGAALLVDRGARW